MNAFLNKLKIFSFAFFPCPALPHMQVPSLESLQECCTEISGFSEVSVSGSQLWMWFHWCVLTKASTNQIEFGGAPQSDWGWRASLVRGSWAWAPVTCKDVELGSLLLHVMGGQETMGLKSKLRPDIERNGQLDKLHEMVVQGQS